MYGLLVGFGLMFDKGQKQSSTLSCDSSYWDWGKHYCTNCEMETKALISCAVTASLCVHRYETCFLIVIILLLIQFISPLCLFANTVA